MGAFDTMLRGHTGEAAIITEPTSGDVVVANAGALTFRLRIPGRAAHGSSRLAGHSAIEAFLPLHAALTVLERERNTHPDPLFANNPLPYPISIGTLRAGDWVSRTTTTAQRRPLRQRPAPLRQPRRHPHPPLRARRRTTRPQPSRTGRHRRTPAHHPRPRRHSGTSMRCTGLTRTEERTLHLLDDQSSAFDRAWRIR